VGLLANGEEAEKGTMVLRDTFHLLEDQQTLNFVGNVEPKEVTKYAADVVVTDGFTGNIMIKTTEAVAAFLPKIFKRTILQGPLATLALILMLPALIVALPGLLLLSPGLRRLAKRLDYAEYGGGLLLGVNGVVIVGHGRSNAKAVKNAIRQAHEAVAGDVLATIKAGLTDNPTDKSEAA
jgi:glycerol-3-phosphate acyltransferase PlsX